LNLLSNAEKYSGDRREIEVEVSRSGDEAEIQVLDRGAGVPAGKEEKIFEQFFRANDSLASGIQGSGLGLTLARQIARTHGGDVRYAPREGGGSCFTLRLPIVPASAADADHPASKQPAT
jgi:signal transduction histidine kinase